jgi:hypothetical protein
MCRFHGAFRQASVSMCVWWWWCRLTGRRRPSNLQKKKKETPVKFF